MPWVEWVGYAASALIVVSLAMTSVVRLRIISLIGAVTFVVYGVLIQAWPVAIANAIIAVLNVWFLFREFTAQRELGAVPITPETPYLKDFLRAHEAEIARNQPGFDGVQPHSKAWLLTRDGLPAGVLVGRAEGSTLHLDLDYVLEAYRDSRLGTWLYGQGSDIFRDAGIRTILADGGDPSHERYLHRVGFERQGEDYVKEL